MANKQKGFLSIDIKDINMKQMLIMLMLVICAGLGAVDILSESFASALPAGWTQSGSANTHWVYSNTATAGGTAGELKMNWDPEETGTFRYVSPAFNTTYVYNMYLSFKQAVDWYQGNFELSVQMSHDQANWTTLWSVTPTADIAAQNVSVTIPWNNGNSPVTYLALVFTGNTYNLNYWFLDNILLSHTDTLGVGTWPAGTYDISGHLITPVGYTFNLGPDTIIRMENFGTISVAGSMQAIGASGHEIIFTTQSSTGGSNGINISGLNTQPDSCIIVYCKILNSISRGIDVQGRDKVRIESCEIYDNSTSGSGGGIYCYNSDITVKNCFVHNNTASVNGSGMFFDISNPVVTGNRIILNELGSASGGALGLRQCNLDNTLDNKMFNNSTPTWGGSAVYLDNCTGGFRYNLISNNASGGIIVNGTGVALPIEHCTIVYNDLTGIYAVSPISVVNSIIYSNGSLEISCVYGNSAASWVRFCDVMVGIARISGIATANIQNIISANPLFKLPPDGSGSGYEAYYADFRLGDLSPCIDAGDYYSGAYDADFSAPDLGLYARRLKPTLYSAADVFPDQGHQIDLRWYPNDKDTSWDPAAWYHVFRFADDRSALASGTVIVNDPREITPELLASANGVAWVHNERILTYLGQVKAMNRDAYSLIVPTLQDSSATGTHNESFVVTYFDNVYFWDSVGLSGYSVDNIPPMAPRNIELSRPAPNALRLDWEEVSEGIWEGNSYPELNAISYRIYASDDPYFVPDASTFLMETSQPEAVFADLAAEKRFFRIVASDSMAD